jgi:hypothetical protein
MSFGQQVIPTKQKELARNEKMWSLKIQDTRNRPSNWKLFVAKKEELTPSDQTKPVITNAFSFVDTSGKKHNLGSVPLEVHTTINGPTISTINWSQTEGLMLTINPGNVYSKIDYNGVIEWTVRDAP